MSRLPFAALFFVCFSSAAVLYAKEAATADAIRVGSDAPKFSVKDDAGKDWESADHYGKKFVVVYFYPADMTGGCTAQACQYRDDMSDLKAGDIEVVGVSGDTVENHQAFKKAYGLNYTLLADVDGKVATAFGVPHTKAAKEVRKSIDGIDFVLKRDVTIKRWTFVIDKAGKIASVDNKVNAKMDSAKIAKLIDGLR